MPSALKVVSDSLNEQSTEKRRGKSQRVAILKYGSDEDDTLFQIVQLNFAVRAAKFGARPPTIFGLTGVKETIGRKLFTDAMGKAPPPGMLPSDPNFFTSTPQIHIESLWLLQTYRCLSIPNDPHDGQVESMLLTYGLYQQRFPEQLVSFDRFFFLVRVTLFGRQIVVEECPQCDGPYLWLATRAYSSKVLCPICNYHDKPHRKAKIK